MRPTFLICGLAQAALVLAAYFSSFALAQQPTTSAPSVIAAAGRVIDADGKSIAGAHVVLREWASLRYSENIFLTEVKDILAEVKSDAEGRFTFENVAAPAFRAFQERAPWDVLAFADGNGFGWAHFEQIAGAQPAFTIALTPAKTIRGRLVDPQGAPVANCKVEFGSVASPGNANRGDELADPKYLSLWRSQLAPSAVSDADGWFEIAGLPTEKRILISLVHPRFARQSVYVATTEAAQPSVVETERSQGASKTVERPVYMPGFTHTLQPSWLIRGRVVHGDSQTPVAGAKVSIWWQNRSMEQLADETGRFEFASLMDPQYYVTVYSEESDYLSARKLAKGSAEDPVQEVTLELPRGIPVRGTVVDFELGTGVSGVEIAYVPPGTPDSDGYLWSPVRNARTFGFSPGVFRMIVPPGPGELRVIARGDVPHPTHDVPDDRRWRQKLGIAAEHSVKIDVAAENPPTDVKLTVGRGLVLRGRAVDGEGQPIAGASVTTRTEKYPFPRGNKVVTDAEGKFEVPGLSEVGAYRVDIVLNERGLSGTAETKVEAWTGLTHVVNLPLTTLTGMARVNGVATADGKSLSGVPVTAFLEITLGERIGMPHQTVNTDAQGKYTLLVPADQEFHVSLRKEGLTSQDSRRFKPASGELVEIPPFELQSLGTFVEGIVVDPDGKPVAGVTISVQASLRGGGRRGGVGFARRGGGGPQITRADGHFRVEELPDMPLDILAYIAAENNSPDRTIRFPARATVQPGQRDIRLIFDPKLKRTPPPLEPDEK